MKFAAVIEYTSDQELIAAVRPVHREYLVGLLANNQLVEAGPFTDDSGAIIVYEAASAADAEKLLQGDPFFQKGIFQKYRLRPWKLVFVKHELLPAT